MSVSQDHEQSTCSALDEVRLALMALDVRLTQIGGCTNGGCIVVRPIGMHTNAGCRCFRDQIKMQQVTHAYRRFAEFVRDQSSAEQVAVKVPGTNTESPTQ